VVIALTAYAARALDTALTARMIELKAGAMSSLESLLGRKITYGRISPSFFRSIEISELALRDPQRPNQSLLLINKLRVTYSLLHLLLDRDPVSAIREIRLLNTRFSINLGADQDVIDLLKRLMQADSGVGRLKARITGSDIAVSLVSRQTSVTMDRLFFQVDAKDGSVALSIRGTCQAKLEDGFTFTSSLRAQGSVDRSLTSADMTVRLLSLQTSLLNAGAQTLQVVVKGSVVDVRKIQDRSPIALSLHADLDTREFLLGFQAQDMRMDRLFTFAQPLARYAKWLALPITASGHVLYRMASHSLEYEADVSAYLEDQLPVRQVTLVTSFRGTEKEAYFQPLKLSSDQGDLQFEGNILFANLYPSGLLTLANVNSGTGEKLSAQLSIDRLEGSLNVYGSQFVLGEVAFDSMQLILRPVADGTAFNLTTSFAGFPRKAQLQAQGELHFGQAIGQAVTEGAAPLLAAPVVSVSASLKSVPPSKLYHLFMGAGVLSREQEDLFNLLGQFSVSADVNLSTDFSSVAAVSRQVVVTGVNDPGTSMRFGLAVNSNHLSLSGFSGTWKGINVQGGFEGDVAPGGGLSFTSSLTFLGTPYTFAGHSSPGSGFVASGSYGLSVAVAPVRGGGFSVQAQGDRYPLPVASGSLPVSFNVSGLVTREGEWEADFPSIVFYDVPFLASDRNTIELQGKLTQNRLIVSRLAFSDAYSTLVGSAVADVTLPSDLLDPQFLHALTLQGTVLLASPVGNESYSVNGALKEGAVSLSVEFSGLPLARIGPTAVQGTLAGSAAIKGPMNAPRVDASLALKEGKLGSDTLALSGQVTLTQEMVSVRSLTVGYLKHRVSDGAGRLDLKNGSYSLNALYRGEYFSDQVSLAAGIAGSITLGTPAMLGPDLESRVLPGKISLTGISVAGTPLPSWGIGYRFDSGRISFDGGPGNSLHGWIDPHLAFAVAFADPLPLSGTLEGRVSGDQINAALSLESADLLIINEMLKSGMVNTPVGPLPIIRVTSGVATGSLTIDGKINDPDFTGQLDVVGGGVLSAYSPDEAGPIRTTLIFDGKGFHSKKTVAAAGTARLSATASFTLDHWAPTAYDITLATEGNTPAHLRVRFGRLNADGSASGQMRIAGDSRATNVTGALVVADCRTTLGAVLPGKFTPEEPPTIVNLAVQTGRRVEFTWPSADLPVLRTTASPGGKVAITYRGDTGAYTVKGSTGVQGGEIYYFDRSFIMKKGSITFNEDQNNFDPRITARAEVREWDPTTAEEVKIYLDADSALSKFSPRFSSVPSRTDVQILAMIGAPIFNRAETQGLGLAALVYGDYLAQNWILRPFEQKVRQLLNLDMFSVRTQIIQNVLAQKLFGSTVNPLDNTSVSLGWYLGNDLFLEMLVRLQQLQSLPDTGASGVNVAGIGLQPDLELSLEWATPFFLLDWSFLPKHPESLFLSDNSLSFSWRYSF
jgi:hypothetical protein